MVFIFRSLYQTRLFYETRQSFKITAGILVRRGVCIVGIFDLGIKPHLLESDARHSDSPPLILNGFTAGRKFMATITDPPSYGLKLSIRKGYGFLTLEAAEAAFYHALGRLPKATLATAFC